MPGCSIFVCFIYLLRLDPKLKPYLHQYRLYLGADKTRTRELNSNYLQYQLYLHQYRLQLGADESAQATFAPHPARLTARYSCALPSPPLPPRRQHLVTATTDRRCNDSARVFVGGRHACTSASWTVPAHAVPTTDAEICAREAGLHRLSTSHCLRTRACRAHDGCGEYHGRYCVRALVLRTWACARAQMAQGWCGCVCGPGGTRM